MLCSAGSSPLARGTLLTLDDLVPIQRFIPARAGNTLPAPSRLRATTVHPRSRGEHTLPPNTSGVDRGSSPLARGTLLRGLLRGRGLRFIPARAGNTGRCGGMSCLNAVHPRSRGEHFSSGKTKSHLDGSSPLARGTPAGSARSRSGGRFIPARAGNTSWSRSSSWSRSVHPRSRGEHTNPSGTVNNWNGSSPLARGTLCRSVALRCLRRFIPARAGNTRSARRRTCGCAVHPRSRGEHCPTPSAIRRPNGSSPLARGTLAGRRRAPKPIRFIPARAGNTGCAASARTPAAVHPRSRGEHVRHRDARHHATGSSPLARGTQDAEGRRRVLDRFIPARAGNTRIHYSGRSSLPVHPRSRGEHTDSQTGWAARPGSSPLARGTQADDERAPVHLRFIPARAGNTKLVARQ